MPDVEFSEERGYSSALNAMGKPPAKGLRALPIKLGLAKDETGADIVLSAVAILAVILGIATYFYGMRAAPPQSNFPGGPPGAVPFVPGPGIQP